MQLFRRLAPCAGIAAFVAAIYVLHRSLREVSAHQLFADLHSIPRSAVLGALALTILDYWVLTAYDVLSLQAMRKRLAYPKVVATAFMAFAFSHNLGYAMLSGGAVRWRFYATWGLAAADIAAITIIGGIAFWVGFLLVGGMAFVGWPPVIASWLSPGMTQVLGGLVLVGVLGSVAWLLRRRRAWQLRHWTLPPPAVLPCVELVALACVDWVLVVGVVWILLPPLPGISFARFLSCFIVAMAAGNISQVPGGLGVLEATLLMLLGSHRATPALAGALLAYRVIYYLLPFVAAMVLLCCIEALRQRVRLGRMAGALTRLLRPLIPHAAAALTFVAGAVLLVSGATPPAPGRMGQLLARVPLPVVEVAHLLGSIVGMALLLLARGLQLRLSDAYFLALLLLPLGAVLSLAKGIDYEEATLLVVVMAAILPFRRHFPRHAALSSPSFTPRWALAVGGVLASSLWLTWFCFHHAGVAGHLNWWQVASEGAAPRSLRAGLAASVMLLAFVLWRLLTPLQPRHLGASAATLQATAAARAASPEAMGNLVLSGDKAVLLSEDRRAFIMYAITGRCWIAMGDAVGEDHAAAELTWQFYSQAVDHGGLPVFYQVTPHRLPLYLDLGLTLVKLGEEARIELATFSLANARKDLRRSHARALKEGVSCAWIDPPEVAPLLPQLREVSDRWLAMKGSAEKAFSMGFFADDYVAQLPVVVARWQGRIVAFATVWPTVAREELSFDLMRFLPEAPRGIMDFLLVELLQAGRAAGYRWFNLGMAPLAGLPDRPHAPVWCRLGSRLFWHGDAFYHFRGLREYKAKFDPVWQPRYLACPGGMAMPRALARLSLLIGGGVRGVLPRRPVAVAPAPPLPEAPPQPG